MGDVFVTHDEIIEKMFFEYQRADKNKYVDLFLSGLSKHKIYLGMAALGYMHNFPNHKFCLLEEWVNRLEDRRPINCKSVIKQQYMLNVLNRNFLRFENLSPDLQEKVKKGDVGGYSYPCAICSGYYNESCSEDIKNFWLNNGSMHTSNELFLFWLEYTNSQTNIPKPTIEDFEVFQVILNSILSIDENEGIRHVLKKIKKQEFYKQWYYDIRKEKIANDQSTEYLSNFVEYRIQLILEMLGFCGILHTEKNKAPFYEFDNIPMANRSSPRSDWQPPVDFWRGKNAIDINVFDYWFGAQFFKFKVD